MFKIRSSGNQILVRATSIHPEWLGTIEFENFTTPSLEHVEFDCILNCLIIAVPNSYRLKENKIWFSVINSSVSDSCYMWLRPGSGYTYKIFENETCYRTVYISYEVGHESTVPPGYDAIVIMMDSVSKEK